MIKSMTAFTSHITHNEWGELIIEIRSLNHKYCDINIKLPEQFKNLEMVLREQIKSCISRGRIDCFVTINYSSTLRDNITVNESLLDNLLEYIDNINEKISIRNKIAYENFNNNPENLSNTSNAALSTTSSSIAQNSVVAANSTTCKASTTSITSAISLLNFPGILSSKTLDTNPIKAIIQSEFSKAIEKINIAKNTEGLALANIIQDKLKELNEIILIIKDNIKNNLTLHREKIISRLHTLGLNYNQERLEQELVLFAQKIDIAEEIDRLLVHLATTNKVIEQDNIVGRKLDFIMQEMMREANTLSAKSINKNIVTKIVDLKVLIEQIREQVQNLE